MRPIAVPVVLIVIGTAFLLDKLGLVPLSQIGPLIHEWWPAGLIAVGLAMLLRARR